jgi:hypothetical protein
MGIFPGQSSKLSQVSSLVGLLPYGFRTSLAVIAFSLIFVLWLDCHYSFFKVSLFLNYNQLEIQRKTENKMMKTNSSSKRGTS